MKKLIKLAGFGALVFGLAVSCTPEKDKETTPPEPETLDVPAGLAFSNLTDTSATLTWDEVEGADAYNVRINDGEAFSVDSNTHEADGLVAETLYTWAVQAYNEDTESEWSEDATFTTGLAPVETPAGLAETDVTQTTATLTWDAVADATGYEVMIDGGEAVTVEEGNSHPLTGLTAETEYEWTVRAIEGDRTGEWAEEKTFTTLPIPVTEVTFTYVTAIDNGNAVSDDTNNFIIDLYENEPTGEGDSPVIDGFRFSLDAISVKIDRDVFTQFLVIPNGDYTLADTNIASTIAKSDNTFLKLYEAGEEIEDYDLTEVKVNIVGSLDSYTVTVEIPYSEGIFRGTYTGKIEVKNSNYNPSAKDLGTLNMDTVEYQSKTYGGGTLDAYVLKVKDESATLEWTVGPFVQFHVAAGAEQAIPEGVYNIASGNAVNTVLAGHRNFALYPNDQQGMQAIDKRYNYYAFTSGTVTVAHVDGNYEITFLAKDGSGNIYAGSIVGSIE